MENQPSFIAPVASIPTLISRTALDSLHAKLSAIDGGWLDGHSASCGDSGNSNNGTVTSYPPLNDTYCKLLRRIHDGMFDEKGQPHRSRRGRQTPLVNAGYAARISVMTYILEGWIKRVIVPTNLRCHSEQGIAVDVSTTSNDKDLKEFCINVVLLGCGMDALGICSKHYLNALRTSKKRLSDEDDRASTDSIPPILPRALIYEFDAWDNCIFKRNALLKSGLLTESFSTESTRQQVTGSLKSSFCTISRGRLVLDRVDDDCEQREDDDYFLMALDFSQTTTIDADDTKITASILSLAMQDVGFDASYPTIILSELVLAYLGYDGANATLQSIAANVVEGNQNSLFVCLEPVISRESNALMIEDGRDPKILSLEEGYSREYSRQFRETLLRGDSRNISMAKGSACSSSTCMNPLGSNLRSIRQHLRKYGFSSHSICHATLGEAAAKVAHIRRMSNNATSFLRAKEPFDEHAALALNLNCYGVVCVFSSILKEDESDDPAICPWFLNGGVTSTVEVNPIASLLDDKYVRDLYGRIYVHLYCQYPAIRKMVNSAMKTDLRDEVSNSSCSAIRHRYVSRGGNFWIATDADKSLVVGCVGVGLRMAKVKDAIVSTSSFVEYEIHRLAVDNQYRGMGIGKKLLLIAEQYAFAQESDAHLVRSSVRVKIRAVTPNCLTTAIKLYESVGYMLDETFQAGSLRMNVYCKTF